MTIEKSQLVTYVIEMGHHSLTLLSKKCVFFLDLSSKTVSEDLLFFFDMLILTNKFALKSL
jgi:hypothetical protein